MVSAIIVAAGGSRRMGFDKLDADLCGRSVIERSVEAFEQCELISEIIIVTSKDKVKPYEAISASKLKAIVEGGSERYLSVSNGIKEASQKADCLAVHDAARPLVTPEAIALCCEVAQKHGAATLARRIVDTLKRSHPGKTTVSDSVDREDLWSMETPQICRRDWLNDAYELLIQENRLVTDEVSAIQHFGKPVHLVENPSPNPKITIPSDMDVARAIIAS